MPILKNTRQEEFCHAMAEGKVTQTEAYIAAGYSATGARFHASRLVTVGNIQARIAEIKANIAKNEAEKQAALEAKVGVSKEFVIRRLQENDALACKIEPPQIPASNKCLELIGKELGMFRDQPSEIKGDVHLHFGVPTPAWVQPEGDDEP